MADSEEAAAPALSEDQRRIQTVQGSLGALKTENALRYDDLQELADPLPWHAR